jgi:phosphoglycolate phosphatase
MSWRAIVFDLDGTLADTLGDLAAAANLTLADRGLPTHPIDSYRAWMGEGAPRLIERALPIEARGIGPSLLLEFRERYAARLVQETRPFPGVVALLDALAARGVVLAVLSNKPHDFTLAIVERLFGGQFRAVFGQREGVPRKPDPLAARALLADWDVAPCHAAMVGDSPIDMTMAKAANMAAIAVGWGYCPAHELVAAGAEICLASPSELLDHSNKPASSPGRNP